MKWWSVVVLAACGGGGVAKPVEKPVPPSARGAEQLIAATRAGDAAAVEKLLAPSVVLGGIWFADTTCRRTFSGVGTLQGDARTAFAQCLAKLPLATSARVHPLPEIAVLTYEPGLEIEVQFGPRGTGELEVRWIGYVARASRQDALPTITQERFLAQRLEMPEVPGAIATKFAAESSQFGEPVVSWFKVCLDGDGKVTSASLRETSSPLHGRVLGEVLQRSTFQPVILGGQPTPVCVVVQIAQPTPTAKPSPMRLPAPLPVGTPDHVKVVSRRLHRRKGDIAITPDHAAKDWMSDHKIAEVRARAVFCIDTDGKVSHVAIAEGSGLPRYDDRIVSALRTWEYEPLTDDRGPIPACSTIEFRYHQIKGRTPFPELR